MSRLFKQLTHKLYQNKNNALLLYQRSVHRFSSLEQASAKLQEILEIPDENIMAQVSNDVLETDTNRSEDKSLGIYKRVKLAKTTQEIDKLLLEYEPKLINLRKSRYCDPLRYPTMHKLYPAAIISCAYLNEESKAWELFNTCKERDILSSYIYSVMMWLTMRFNRSKEGLTQVFDLFHEMKNETTLIPTAMLDAALINSCLAVCDYERAYDVLNKLKRNKNALVLLSSQRLCTSICRLYVMSDNIDNGLRFMFNNYKTCRMVPSSSQCHLLLRGMANKIDIHVADEQKERYLLYAQKLLDFAFDKNKGTSPGIYVYASYVYIFAKIGDYKTCVDLLKCMKDNELYPQPNLITCCSALMSFVYLNEGYPDNIEIETQKKHIQEIVDVMNELEIERNNRYYAILYKICKQHKDVEGLFAYYNSIENKTNENVETMATFAIECLDEMRKVQNVDEKIAEFKPWVVDEYTTHSTALLTEKENAIEKFAKMIDSL